MPTKRREFINNRLVRDHLIGYVVDLIIPKQFYIINFPEAGFGQMPFDDALSCDQERTWYVIFKRLLIQICF